MSDVIDELVDRFGEPPKSVMGLIDIALLRNKAMAADIYEIVKDGNDVALHLTQFNQETFLKLGSVFGDRMKMNNSDVVTFIIRPKKAQNISSLITEIVKAL